MYKDFIEIISVAANPQLWYHLPAIDTFTLSGKIYELDDAETKKRIACLAERFEIGDLLETLVRSRSRSSLPGQPKSTA